MRISLLLMALGIAAQSADAQRPRFIAASNEGSRDVTLLDVFLTARIRSSSQSRRTVSARTQRTRTRA